MPFYCSFYNAHMQIPCHIFVRKHFRFFFFLPGRSNTCGTCLHILACTFTCLQYLRTCCLHECLRHSAPHVNVMHQKRDEICDYDCEKHYVRWAQEPSQRECLAPPPRTGVVDANDRPVAG